MERKRAIAKDAGESGQVLAERFKRKN